MASWYDTKSAGEAVPSAGWNSHVAYSRQMYNEGILSTPTIERIDDTHISITTCDVLIRSDAVFGADDVLWKATVAENTNLAISNAVVTYIYVAYNSGTPIYAATTSRNDLNHSNNLPVARVIMGTGSIEYQLSYGAIGKGAAARNTDRVLRIRGSDGIERESGLTITETATRVINLGAGFCWFGLDRLTSTDLPAIVQTDGDVVSELWYHTGVGTWAHTSATAYNNTQYDKLTATYGLTTLSAASRYAVNWVFRNITTKEIDIVLGTGDYTLAQAEASMMPTLPPAISAFYVLCGRIIVQKSIDTAYAIQNISDTTFTQSTTTVHSELSNLGYADAGHTGFAPSTHSDSIKWSAVTALYDLPPTMGGTGATIGYQKMSNGIVNAYLEFQNDTAQYLFLEGVFDKDWDETNLTGILRWYTTSADTNQVIWKLYGIRYTDGATRDLTVNTLLATITQSNQGALYQNVTTETSAFTLAGTGRNFILMLTRDYGAESPSLAAYARFLNFEIYNTRTLV